MCKQIFKPQTKLGSHFVTLQRSKKFCLLLTCLDFCYIFDLLTVVHCTNNVLQLIIPVHTCMESFGKFLAYKGSTLKPKYKDKNKTRIPFIFCRANHSLFVFIFIITVNKLWSSACVCVCVHMSKRTWIFKQFSTEKKSLQNASFPAFN